LRDMLYDVDALGAWRYERESVGWLFQLDRTMESTQVVFHITLSPSPSKGNKDTGAECEGVDRNDITRHTFFRKR
jgi:hypothetical protein